MSQLILHWSLKETNYRSISDGDRCELLRFTHFLALSNSNSAEKSSTENIEQ